MKLKIGRGRPLWAGLLGQVLAPWLRLSIQPPPKGSLPAGPTARRVCYILEKQSLAHLLILDRACREAGLPSPLESASDVLPRQRRSWLALFPRPKAGPAQMFAGSARRQRSSPLQRLMYPAAGGVNADLMLIPVSVFIGRIPRAQGWLSVLFSEDWALIGRFRRMLAIAVNGRDTYVHFAAPIDLRKLLTESLPPERMVRKLARVLRVHFRRVRVATIGPDLSTRRLLVDKVLDAPAVRAAIAAQALRDKTHPAKARGKAHAYAYEIAADYSHTLVRTASLLLTPIWNRIYRGVQVGHLEGLRQRAPGHEVVYVPSHRSTMDDLLLPYLLYTNGIAAPHIVAGINLNLPVIGTLMRKGGAFFIRRTIVGNALYSAVLSEYMAQLISGGYSLAYFIEGGRSRTGRLLSPKGGMLAMTVRGFLRQPTRPVLFQPVYIGYEKILEGTSYLDELAGIPKQKESIWQFLSSIPKILRTNYGKVVVNFGDPIALDDVLSQHASQWDGSALGEQDKPKWLGDVVDALAQQINERVNACADVNPINLLAMALLSTPKHAMGEVDLLEQISLNKRLLISLPYSESVTVTPMSAEQVIAHGEAIGILIRTAHPMGDVLSVGGDDAVLLSYFRNNVLHLFTAAAWIACCFQHNRRMTPERVELLGRNVYPFLKNELFLPWTEDQFAERLSLTLALFVAEGLLEHTSSTALMRSPGQTDEVFRLRAIGHSLQQAFERYYIALSALAVSGSGTLRAAELETLCHLVAQRLSILYAPAAPEFFDKTLFRGFIQNLRQNALIWLDVDGKLAFDERVEALAKEATVVLGREQRHVIERLSALRR